MFTTVRCTRTKIANNLNDQMQKNSLKHCYSNIINSHRMTTENIFINVKRANKIYPCILHFLCRQDVHENDYVKSCSTVIFFKLNLLHCNLFN